jgi:hypothetical protein
VRKLVIFLFVIGLGISLRGVAAQELSGGAGLGEKSPEPMYLDESPVLQPGSMGTMLPDGVELPPQQLEPLPAPVNTGDLQDTASIPSVFPSDESLRAFDCQQALLESTGTWLQRGFWFAEADAVLLHRSYSRHDVVLMVDETVSNNFFLQANELVLAPGRPGAEGTARLKVGRFLFRDHENRDHTAEFTIYGGGDWSQSGRLDGTLSVPFVLTGGDFTQDGNPSFNGAQSSQFNYDSWFNSFELNYHVKQRLTKDRMELEPSGHWVRRAQPSMLRSYFAGGRYFDLDERLNWDAFGIPDANDDGDEETGNYHIRTGNHLLGTQLGFTTAYQSVRWSLGMQAKGGMYLNMQTMNSDFEVTNLTNGTSDLETDGLAWIGEGALIGKWYLRPNFALRTSLEVMHVAGVALAPKHINFNPNGSQFINSASELVFLGGAIGFEGYW